MIIECRQGCLQGIEEHGVFAFYDIPYASNQGRWQKAGEAPTWDDIRMADKPGVVFPQTPSRLADIMGNKKEEENQSEDAFRLNIWTKGIEEQKPVVVWIHGGGFITGGGSLPWYHGTSLADHGDVVVVNVQYRLGVLGHLYLPDLAEENLALKDLMAALHWVKNNITAFGGDPSQITLAGQSAGAWYIVALMGYIQAKGLFQKVALFSYPGGIILPLSHEKANKMTRDFLKATAVNSIDELKTLPIEQILAAQKQVVSKYQGFSFVPTIDRQYVWEDLNKRAVEISGGAISVYSGGTSEEFASFVAPIHNVLKWIPPFLVYKVLSGVVPFEQKEQFWKTFKVNSRKDHRYHRIVSLGSQMLFTESSNRLTYGMQQKGSDGFVYRFQYPSKDQTLMACHCFDLPFLFGNYENWNDAPMCHNMNIDEYRKISSAYQQAFLQFVKSGNPSTKLNQWHQYDGNLNTIRIFTI